MWINAPINANYDDDNHWFLQQHDNNLRIKHVLDSSRLCCRHTLAAGATRLSFMTSQLWRCSSLAVFLIWKHHRSFIKRPPKGVAKHSVLYACVRACDCLTVACKQSAYSTELIADTCNMSVKSSSNCMQLITIYQSCCFAVSGSSILITVGHILEWNQ